MPKTIIKARTYMCPIGVGRVNATCRFHRAADNLPSDSLCPTHGLLLVLSTHPDDQITITVMGIEEVDTEIQEELDTPGKRRIDVSTAAAQASYRAKRQADIDTAIKEAMKRA